MQCYDTAIHQEQFARRILSSLDRHPDIQTLQQIDNEILRWSRDIVVGRKFTKASGELEAKHTASSFYHDTPIVQDEGEDKQQEHSSSVSDNQGQRNVPQEAGAGVEDVEQPTTAETLTRGLVWCSLKTRKVSINYQYQQEQIKLLLKDRGHPRCNHCSIQSFTRSNSRIWIMDVKNAIKRIFHLNRGQLQSNNQ